MLVIQGPICSKRRSEANHTRSYCCAGPAGCGCTAEATRAYGNVLTRCFGTDGEPVPVDVFHVKLKVNDRLLLCSDGCQDGVDPDIESLVTESGSNEWACEALVAAGWLAGGRDNITVVLARMLDSMMPHPLDHLHAEIEQIDMSRDQVVRCRLRRRRGMVMGRGMPATNTVLV